MRSTSTSAALLVLLAVLAHAAPRSHSSPTQLDTFQRAKFGPEFVNETDKKPPATKADADLDTLARAAFTNAELDPFQSIDREDGDGAIEKGQGADTSLKEATRDEDGGDARLGKPNAPATGA
ncbi:hypothetical protein JCM21900_002084 [Sporobolomyces salmonicolor]